MEGFTVNSQGILEIAGVPVTEIAQKCGTPVYVYDASILKAHMQSFVSSFQGFGFDTQVIYASKAFNCIAMLQLCQQEGLGLDVVSGGELYTAIKAGFDMKNVYFHGNNKSLSELKMALENGVGCIVLDNLMEAKLLACLAEQYPQLHTACMLRVNPGIDAHTHRYIQTAYIDSKFGITIMDLDQIAEIVQTVQACENLEFVGFHAHIGSQIFEKSAFVQEVNTMMAFIKDFQTRTGIVVSQLDLGGGFAAYYTSEDAPIDVKEICPLILETCRKANDAHGLHIEKVLIEPGRSIAANAGIQLYTVGFLKTTPNKHYVFIDGGMCDNIRPALYQAAYSADVATNMLAEKSDTVTIAGKCCESGDIIAADIALQPCKTGDLLVVYTTGAYGYAMASNYNKIPFNGVVFAENGKLRWVIKPQSYEELIGRECSEEIL